MLELAPMQARLKFTWKLHMQNIIYTHRALAPQFCNRASLRTVLSLSLLYKLDNEMKWKQYGDTRRERARNGPALEWANDGNRCNVSA